MFFRKAAFATALFLLGIPSAPAAFSPGDILVNDFGKAQITQYSSVGTVIQIFSLPAHTFWNGAAITPDGNVVSTFRSDANGHAGFVIFHSDGTLVTVHIAPELDNPSRPGDVTVFPDGTLAIADVFGSAIRLYSQTGTLVRTIAIPSSTNPFGGALAKDNTLWVGDDKNNSLIRLREDGAILNTYLLSFSPGDIAVVPGDGSLWIPDIHSTNNFMTSTVHHISSLGADLGSFSFNTANGGFAEGVALASDGSLYLDALHNATLYHYSTSGSFLNSLFLPASFDPSPGSIGPAIVTVILEAPEPSSLGLLIGTALFLSPRGKRKIAG